MSQIFGRAWFRLCRPAPDLRPAPPPRAGIGAFAAPAVRAPVLLAADRLRVLDREFQLDARLWNDASIPALELYNLHYFDALAAADDSTPRDWQQALVRRWIAENPPALGIGWQPYPTSLRIVNWAKWLLRGQPAEPAWRHSLAVQARQLERRIEWHLLGNHLFSNAKALLFAAALFDGPEARRWQHRGLAILARELPEQVLADGGQFERSPMYHALAFEDLLDLVNLSQAVPGLVPPAQLSDWRATAARMRRWLELMSHPDGEIGLFNDAAFGVAPPPALLHDYADRLAIAAAGPAAAAVTRLEPSGYARVQLHDWHALLDLAPVGPDYLPGHAHADTLSFELSLAGRRLLVNGGTGCYGVSAERVRQRGTAAHSTVLVDGRDSSEVWSGFRVGRRAHPLQPAARSDGAAVEVECGHDGYRPLLHRRRWRFTPDTLEVRDRLDGRFGQAQARLHLHPDARLELDADGRAGRLAIGAAMLRWSVQGGRARAEAGTWHPRFNCAVPNQVLVLEFDGPELHWRLAA